MNSSVLPEVRKYGRRTRPSTSNVNMSSSTLASFKSAVFNYNKSALAVSYDCEDPRSFKSIMVLVQYRVVCSCSISCLGVFLKISCFLL